MKVRHVLIILCSLLLLAFIGVVALISSGAGYSRGFADGEAGIVADENKDTSEQSVFDLPKEKWINVTAAPQFNKQKPITADGFGQVIASSMINVTAEVQGIIDANVTLKKGTKFNKGQLLFSIKNDDVKMALKARKSNYMTLLTAILPDLKLDYADNFDAWLKFFNAIDVEKSLPPLPETKDFKEKNFIVSRNVYSEYYNIQSDEERLKKYNVFAPFDGSIMNAFTDNGAMTGPGSPVLSIIREGNMELEVPISGTEIDYVKEGAKVILYDEVGTTATGKVERIGNYINPQTQTVPVFIAVEESSTDLYNGMYLNAEIAGEGVENVIELPRKALFNKDEVYVVENDRIYSRKVDIKIFSKNTIVVRGVKDGTVIVLEPIINAKDSLQVNVLNPQKLK